MYKYIVKRQCRPFNCEFSYAIWDISMNRKIFVIFSCKKMALHCIAHIVFYYVLCMYFIIMYYYILYCIVYVLCVLFKTQDTIVCKMCYANKYK